MAYRLTKQTKSHIADRAVREKYKAAFDQKMKAFIADVTQQAYTIFQNEHFEGVHPVVLNACSSTTAFQLYNDSINIKPIYVALQHDREEIDHLQLDRRIYGGGHRIYGHEIKNKTLYRDLVVFIKEVLAFHAALMDAMQPFKSADKMLKALPWAEEFYPDHDKTPACNIVPVSLIEKANELMGVKPEGKEHV